jgi:hypothetical protein
MRLPLRRLLALTPPERRLLIRATCLVVVIRLSLGKMPFTVLRRVLVSGGHTSKRAAKGERASADKIVWAVRTASERLPGTTTCLTHALAVHAMLAASGYPSLLHFGVMRGSQGKLRGHAWVEHEGRILIGGSAPAISQFARLAAFDVESVCQPTAVGALKVGQ